MELVEHMGIGNRIKLNRKKRAIKIRILLEQVPLTYNRRYVVTQLDLGEGKYGLDFAFCKIMNAPWPPPLPPPPQEEVIRYSISYILEESQIAALHPLRITAVRTS